MPFPWRNLQSLPRSQTVHFSFHFQHQLAFQYIKKLPCLRVRMTLLLRASRHPFLYHTQRVAPHKVPPIANRTPNIMRSRSSANFVSHNLAPSIQQSASYTATR
jgi:hypothetical protein